jgi:hypothetical protein
VFYILCNVDFLGKVVLTYKVNVLNKRLCITNMFYECLLPNIEAAAVNSIFRTNSIFPRYRSARGDTHRQCYKLSSHNYLHDHNRPALLLR